MEVDGIWFNDAWALENGEWHELPKSTWDERGDFGFVALPNGTLLVAGGQQRFYEHGNPPMNDVHVLHKGASEWEQMDDAPWSPRVGHHMASCPDGSIIMTGGANMANCVMCDFYADVWRLSPQGIWTQIIEKAPWGERRLHRTVCLSDGSLIFSSGHSKGHVMRPAKEFNDLWRMSPTGKFEKLKASAPWEPRTQFMMSAGPNDVIVVAGGYTNTETLGYGDTWTVTGAAASSEAVLSFQQQQDTFPFDAAGMRWEAGMAALPNNTHVLIGGKND